MSLINLPEEIIRIIIKYLDIKSIKSLYETCRYLRGLISMSGCVRKCKISKSTLATAEFLKTNLFKHISPYIQDLDLSTVPNLCKTSFLAAVKNLRALRTLNVSYTSLKLEHLVDLLVTCPELKNICANFDFAEETTDQSLLRIQNFMGRLENVHFVCPVGCILFSTLPFIVLEKAKLKSLKFTLLPIRDNILHPESDDIPHKVPDFQELNIYYLGLWNTEAQYLRLNDLPIIKLLDINLFEFIVMCFPRYNMAKLYISDLFQNFFSKYSNLNVSYINNLNSCNQSGNSTIKLWKKCATKFDDVFFYNLSNNIKQMLAFRIQEDELTLPNIYDRFIVEPNIMEEFNEDATNELKIKKRRIGVKEKVLDYDQLFSTKEEIQLCFEFNYATCPITLPPNSNYLSKITYLSLCGSFKVSSNFFSILFRCCVNMKTLELKIHFISNCLFLICKSLPLSNSLRNFRLVTKRIKFNDILSALSHCKAIENISINEISVFDELEVKENIDPSLLFKNCDNLYSLHLDFPTSQTHYKDHLRPMFTKALAKYNKRFLNLVLCPSLRRNERNFYNYNLFLEEFRLNKITII